MTSKTLALIPARGGSKRLPRKNVKDFLGKPLIAWTIEVAKESGAFDHVVVVTDDEEIAAIAKRYGAEVPFMEPKELAGDTAYVADALRFALEELKKGGYAPEHFVLLEPSSVGREAKHIREVAEIMATRKDFDSLLGISETPGHYSYLKQYHIGEGGLLGRVGDGAPLKAITHRNQDVAKSYVGNSAIYAFRTKNLFEGDRKLWGDSTYGYVMDGSGIADIDTQEEWDLAEFKMRRKWGIS